MVHPSAVVGRSGYPHRARRCYHDRVKVHIGHQRRYVALQGPRSVREMLRELDLNPETVIVIRGGELLTADAVLSPDDEVEIRPVVSGGGRDRTPGGGGMTSRPRVRMPTRRRRV